ncbi:hypothetical protein ABZY16_16085 [Streptomyces sp. NPDC006553]|uniref:hypothetical protein n=1 Tax=unclassified Streptomyces TaxID=2593676 RepID=UPI00225A873D|nr:hypothetical protein [Streptomyces sp. NBC_00233]MCX5231296.1 hypothetical protein [Streptomyces sp. NBC_00233]
MQVLTGRFGELLWVSRALLGSTHDLTAARQHGISEALTEAGIKRWPARGVKARADRPRAASGRRLKRWKRRHNSTHCHTCRPGEQAMADLRGRRLLLELHGSTNRMTDVVKAARVGHLAST